MFRCGSDVLFLIFFVKQKTAYEMRISDWSSDVCSSELPILRTNGLVASSVPMARALLPITTLNTPLGKPARSASSASANAENGVIFASLITTGHPTARAGAHLRVILAFGKFHGVIEPTTPTGCLRTRIRLTGAWVGTMSP